MNVSRSTQLQGIIETERAHLHATRVERPTEATPTAQLTPGEVFEHRQYYAQAHQDVQGIRYCASFPKLS